MTIFTLMRTACRLLLLALMLAVPMTTVYASGGHGHDDHDEHDEHNEHEEHEPQKGPHGGRLLTADDMQVELAIFEEGVPPEYRAWITRAGKPVDHAAATLTVELTRLGGRVDRFTFKPQQGYLLGSAVVEEPHSFAVTVTASAGGASHEWEYESYEGRVQIAPDIAAESGIKTAIAEAGSITETLLLYGKVVPDPQHVSHVRARFPGLITHVSRSLGDTVKAGEPILEIEANESLKRYRVLAPIGGVVVESHANVGELATDEPLLTIASHDKVWLELSVFSQDVQRIKPGQAVGIRQYGQAATSHIAYLNPGAGETPYLLARVPVANRDGAWIPGMMAEADVTVAEVSVPLRVDNRALQDFRDWRVVFIQVGDTYEIRPLELGRGDGRFTEVLSGLNAGDRYVVENSYLLKADLEKSGASHDH